MRLIDEQGDEWITEEPSSKPRPKIIAAAAIGTPVAVLIAWLLSLWDIDMPAEVGAALGALVAAVVGYLKREETSIEWADDGHAEISGLVWVVVGVLAAIALVVWIVNNT